MTKLLKLFRIVLLLFIILINCEFMIASNYNHKLWRISGKNLTKDSYIFVSHGTIEKNGFILEDSIYSAFKNSELIIFHTNMFDEKMVHIPQIQNRWIFNFEDYFSEETLNEMRDSVESRGGDFKRLLKSKDAYELFRSLRNNDERKYMKNTYKIANDIQLIHLALLENKEFDKIFDINYNIIFFQKYDDDIKASRILEVLRNPNKFNYPKSFPLLYRNNMLDSIYRFTIDSLETPESAIDLINERDSVYKFILKTLDEKQFFAALPISRAIGDDGLIDRLRKSGYVVEPVLCNTYSDLYQKVSEYGESEWDKFNLEKLNIEVNVPKYCIHGHNNEMRIYGNQYFDLFMNISFFVELFDTPDFTKSNPLTYFNDYNQNLKKNYTEKINLKQLFKPDSLIRFEYESIRNKFYSKYHLVYHDKKIFKISVITDTFFVDKQYIDKFLNSYKLKGDLPEKRGYIYISPSKDFQIEFSDIPKEATYFKSDVYDFRQLSLFDRDLKARQSRLLNSDQLRKTRFLNEDSLLIKVAEQNYKLFNKGNSGKLSIRKFSDYQGFSCIDYSCEQLGSYSLFRSIFTCNRVYNLAMVCPTIIEDSLFNEYANSLKITLNIDTSFHKEITKTAKFNLPDHLIQETFLEDFGDEESQYWDVNKYFNSQVFIDTILGFSIYYKYFDWFDHYFDTEEAFTSNSLEYITDNFGEYNLLYCKPYSDKIKNSYIFEVESKASKAVMKGIFYPYKNSTHCLEVRTHRVFLDSSYLRDVFNSFEFTFEPEQEQELFRNKLLDVTKKLFSDTISKNDYNVIRRIRQNLQETKDPVIIMKSIEYILEQKRGYPGILGDYFSKFLQVTDPKESSVYLMDMLKDFDISKLKLYYQILNSLSSLSDSKFNLFVFKNLVNLGKYLNEENIDDTSGTFSNYEYTLFDELETVLQNLLRDNYNYDAIPANLLKQVLENRYYLHPIIINFYPDIFYKRRESGELIFDEAKLIHNGEQIINAYNNSEIDEEFDEYPSLFNKYSELVIFLCRTEESRNHIENKILTSKHISDENKFLYYCLYNDKTNEFFDNFIKEPRNKSFAFFLLRKIGKLHLLPEEIQEKIDE